MVSALITTTSVPDKKEREMKDKQNIILTPQFLDDWSDRCNLPVTQMKEIYNALKETLKSYVDERKEVQLANFIYLTPKEMTPTIHFHNVKTGERVTKKRTLPFAYKARLSQYLKYPYPYDEYDLNHAEK